MTDTRSVLLECVGRLNNAFVALDEEAERSRDNEDALRNAGKREIINALAPYVSQLVKAAQAVDPTVASEERKTAAVPRPMPATPSTHPHIVGPATPFTDYMRATYGALWYTDPKHEEPPKNGFYWSDQDFAWKKRPPLIDNQYGSPGA